jgi:hypothetical protein
MTAQKRLLIPLVLLLSLNLSPIAAQTSKKKTAKEAPKLPIAAAAPQRVDDKEAVATVDRLLAQLGQKYTKAPSGIWIIPRESKLRSFQVVLSYTAGTLTTEVVVARGRTVPRLNEAALHLLGLANRLPYVKICIDKDNDVFVRNEAALKFLNQEEFSMHLESVAAAADEVYAGLQSFR